MSPIVAIPDQPGESVASVILPDVERLKRLFKITITDGYGHAPHSPTGEHPVGMAIDIVPDTARGGSWDLVDKLAAFAAKHPEIFRYVYYDGRFGTIAEAGHGRPGYGSTGGNHLHLSWHGGPTEPGKATPLLTGGGSVATGLGGSANVASGGGIDLGNAGAIAGGAVAGPAGALVGGQVVDTVGDVASGTFDVAKAIAKFVADPGRAVLTIALVIGGVALAALGLARMTGVRAPVPTPGGGS